jgi:hypothetical protein
LALFRSRSGTIGLACFTLLEFIAISTAHRVFYRYLLIPLPAIAILIGMALAAFTNQVSAVLGDLNASLLATTFMSLVLMPFLMRDIELDRLLMRTDTRILAERWIERNIPPWHTVAMTYINIPYGKPQLPEAFRTVPMKDVVVLRSAGVRWVISDSLEPLGYYSPGPSETELSQLNAQATLKLDINPLRPESAIPIFDQEDAFYAPLANVTSMERPGPRIRIWELK